MDKEQLLNRKAKTLGVKVDGVGTFVVRPLSRADVLSIKRDGMSLVEAEAWMLHLGMVDPAMTVEEIQQWQQVATANEVGPVVDAIMRLSGLEVRADKAALKSAAE